MKKRLYDRNFGQNENGKELFSRIQDATDEIIDEFFRVGFHPHDIERIASMAIINRVLVKQLLAGKDVE